MQEQAASDLSNIRIVGYHLVAPDQLLANPLNPRRHPPAQREALRASLREVGWIAPVLQNIRTGHLLDGHARVEDALTAGVPEVPVIDVDVPEEQEALILATYDPITGMAVMDRTALTTVLADAQTDNPALQALLAKVRKEGGVDFDLLPAPKEFVAFDANLDTAYRCPHCAYEWSGAPKP